MSLYAFQLIVISYSMIILVLIYVFQFDEVPGYVMRELNLDQRTLSSLGFERFEQKDQLFVKLLTPATFLIVNIIQINYFHRSWLKLTENKIM